MTPTSFNPAPAVLRFPDTQQSTAKHSRLAAASSALFVSGRRLRCSGGTQASLQHTNAADLVKATIHESGRATRSRRSRQSLEELAE